MMYKFSCLMSVYHGDVDTQLDAALHSITINQTLKPNQIVLVIDGPVDSALSDVVKKYQNNFGSIQFDVLELQHNSGLAEALNKGSQICRYDLIARMDSDDISEPTRFEKQIEFFRKNNNVDVLGGQIIEFPTNHADTKISRPVPTTHNKIFKMMKYRNAIRHPTVMLKTKLLREVGLYPNEYPEDYFLWIEMLNHGARFANLDDVLVHMRTDTSFFDRRSMKMLRGEIKVLQKLLSYNQINYLEFIAIATFRTFLRTAPKKLKAFLYNY